VIIKCVRSSYHHGLTAGNYYTVIGINTKVKSYKMLNDQKVGIWSYGFNFIKQSEGE